MAEKRDNPSYLKALAVPALTVGAGVGAGHLLGGAAVQGLLSSKRFRRRLLRMTPAERDKWRRRISVAGYSAGMAAGAGTSYLTREYIRDQMERLKEKKQREKEKTASMYSACISHLMESL